METATTVRYAGFERELVALTRLYKAHDSGIDARHVRRVVEEGWAAKVHLRDILGLGDDLRVRFKIKPMERDLWGHPFIHRVGRFIYEALGPETRGALEDDLFASMISGKVVFKGREVRLGKFLSGRIPEDAWVTERDGEYQRDYAEYLLKRGADPADLSKRTFNDALSKALELVGNLGRDSILSFNPMDILLASERAGYRSCHRFGGEHGNGPIAYARDGFTGIVFHADMDKAPEYPFYKTGRAMVFVTAPYTAYTIGRGYGSIGDASGIKSISEFIGSRISESRGLAPTWVGKANHIYDGAVSNNQAPIYFDFNVSRYTYHKSLTADERYPAPDLRLEHARCLCCGSLTDKQNGLTCADCDVTSVSCDKCGERYNADYEGQYYNGENYCQSCADDHLSYCEGCHSVCLDEEIRQVYDCRGYEVYRCSECVSCYYQECEDCRSIHPKDTIYYSEHHQRYICGDCWENYTRCEACNDWIEFSEVCVTKRGEYLGPCCIEDNHTECPCCAEWVPDETLKSVDGQVACDDCAADAVECRKCGELTMQVTEVPQLSLLGDEGEKIAVCGECA